MKIKSGYVLREVVDVFVIIGTDSETYSPNEMMSLNAAGAFLWNILKDGADVQELVTRLMQEYEVDEKTAAKDVDVFLGQLREKDLITE